MERADIGFLVDSSGSIRDKGVQNWDQVKDFLVQIVRSVNVNADGVRIGVVKFSHIAELEFRLDRYTTEDEVVAAIRRMSLIGLDTNTQAGLRLMRTRVFNNPGDRANAPDIVIVITDGISTIQEDRTIPEAELLKRDGVRVIAVGVTNDVDVKELNAIASGPEFVLTSPDFAELQAELEDLLDITCRIITPAGRAGGPVRRRSRIPPSSPVSGHPRWRKSFERTKRISQTPKIPS